MITVVPDEGSELAETPVDFGAFVRKMGGAASGGLVVQPRMGISAPEEMRAGLMATKAANATTVGTITLDSYTRVGNLKAADTALREGIGLNGYPIVNHPRKVTRHVLSGTWGQDFPVQIRHGSATPRDIFSAMMALRLNATEGGPVSYCLPYGRTPLADSMRNWEECSDLFAQLREIGVEPHLESFGGCMMGQLCPPSQLIAMAVLEAIFFYQHGLRSISVSYAQQTNMVQDIEGVFALRRLCQELVPTDNVHVVIYAYMGVYPTTEDGAYRLLGQAAELGVTCGAERIIVKTKAESKRIPVVSENVEALEYASGVAARTKSPAVGYYGEDTETYLEAKAIVDAVLNLDADVGHALLLAFKYGYMDIPYCVHPDNMGRTRSYIDERGWLRWSEIGSLPLGKLVSRRISKKATSTDLLRDLQYVRGEFDCASWAPGELWADREGS
ncbi:methylaspartate mutase [Amycolatopsis sp. NPDC059657]|uniref:methylaspartate mutase n=1 Tax=Amycolatopsis sp. NPDC059657 TaxID=3346899 RepID=UPI0036700917